AATAERARPRRTQTQSGRARAPTTASWVAADGAAVAVECRQPRGTQASCRAARDPDGSIWFFADGSGASPGAWLSGATVRIRAIDGAAASGEPRAHRAIRVAAEPYRPACACGPSTSHGAARSGRATRAWRAPGPLRAEGVAVVKDRTSEGAREGNGEMCGAT